MNEHQNTRKRPLWTWLCSVSPWLLFFLLIAMAVHIRFGLGHWPRPMTEDYPSLAFKIHDAIVGGVFLFTLYLAGPLWLACLFRRELRLSVQEHIRQAVAYGSGWLAIVLAGKYDPTTFTEWLLD